ncbi:MAG: alanine racemase [Candidatus Omnitrophica bacterium]|nr:alanine racemase [Candidatus Omnitrophota bacterium]
MAELLRATRVEIDLSAIQYNLAQLKARLTPATQCLAVVKANGYGHGMVEVARAVLAAGADWLGVASIVEAVALRQHDIDAPILVHGAALPEDAEALVEFGLRATICDESALAALDRASAAAQVTVPVHVKLDTGMGRLGLWHEEAAATILPWTRYKHVVLEGLYTHLACADEDAEATREQLAAFACVVEKLEAAHLAIPLKHTANSAAAVAFPDSHWNLVRPGLMLYGLYPNETLRHRIPLRPALTWKSRITFLKQVPAGRAISYGRTHITKAATAIATIPVGYADGYSRHLSNRGVVLVRNTAAPVVGRVCMDHLMIDVGRVSGAAVGDEVVLLGAQDGVAITAEELATLAGTIPYEIVTAIAGRVPRLYHRPSVPMPAEPLHAKT